MMKGFIYYLSIAVVFLFVGWFSNVAWNLPRSSGNPISEIKPRTLDKYNIENLSKTSIAPAEIIIDSKLVGPNHKYCTEKCTTYSFNMIFDPALSDGTKKSVSGIVNIPDGKGPFPLIVMLRGFVDTDGYYSGEGTQPAAQVFAKNGYITIAPDFLGYGSSDKQADDIFESRFQTWTTVLTLLKTLESNNSLRLSNQPINYSSIGIWGHSNGGQIALTTLEITGGDYPTVLWAPVSKPFPYSILFFTDSPGDYGKSLRLELAKFEQNYDVDLYSLHRYFDHIKTSLELNQGSNDESVPVAWSDLLNKTLKDLKIDITYNIYPGNDHNMRPNWNVVIEKNLLFYQKHLK